MNMVRAGVVSHPGEWNFCWYNEIQCGRQRYSIIDYESLLELFGCGSVDDFRRMHRSWVEESIEKQSYRERQPCWTESIAVGSEPFVRDTKARLGIKGRGRGVVDMNGCYELRETVSPYSAVLMPENADLRQENTFKWDILS